MASSPILEYVTSMANQPDVVPATVDTSNFATVKFVENDQFICLKLDVPGVMVQDLNVELQRGILLVRGSREMQVAPGYRHQHRFCRRFAIDTDVVNIERFQANLNKRGTLTIMAPKVRLPTTLQISVTEQEDGDFLAGVAQSFQRQQEEMEAIEEEEKEEEEEALTTTTEASLPNVVSIGSASEALKNQSKSVKPKHKKMQSHEMIRRSMARSNKGKKGGNAAWTG